ncbi:MAG: prepilin peptidase [Actinomycetota bacterium]
MQQGILSAAGLVFAAALVGAAASDLRAFRIPDRFALVLLAAFVPAAWAAGLPWATAFVHLGVALGIFAVSAGLFALGVWGGGDAKLLPAAALWIGLAALPRFLLVMAVAGGLLAVLLLVFRRLPLPAGSWLGRTAATGHVPYGVAIAAAGLDWWAATLLPRLVG